MMPKENMAKPHPKFETSGMKKHQIKKLGSRLNILIICIWLLMHVRIAHTITQPERMSLPYLKDILFIVDSKLPLLCLYLYLENHIVTIIN